MRGGTTSARLHGTPAIGDSFGVPRRAQEYAIPAVLYVVAVAGARWMGFRARIPWDYYQLLDAQTLRAHPLASLCLMHVQPPALNALLAGILAAADTLGCVPETLVAVLFVALGLVAAVVVHRLATAVTGSRGLGALALAFVLTDPAYHSYANLFFYEFLLYVLHLLLLAAALRYLEHGRGLLVVGLVAATITTTRSLFHPIWTVAVCGLVVWLGWRWHRTSRRQLAALAVLVAGLISLWPLKNRIVFGHTFYATMTSYNLARGVPGCGSLPFNLYLQTGVAWPAATALATRPIDLCGAAAAGVLLSPAKVDGSRNWNHVALLAAAEEWDRCGLAWRLHNPGKWLLRAAGQYVMWMRGGYVWPYAQSIMGPSNRIYRSYATRYDRLLFADLRPFAESLLPSCSLHRAAMVRGHPVPYTLFGFVVFPLTIVVVLVRWARGPWTHREAAVAVALLSIFFAMTGACATDGIEGNRMRFSTAGLLAVVLAYGLQGARDVIRRRS